MRLKPFLLIAGAFCVLALASPAEASIVDVSTDGETYLVDGAVIHHSRFENDRREAASCTTCHWRIHLICRSWSDTAHGACPSLSAGCPRDETVAEVFRADASSRPALDDPLWHQVGHTCVGDGGPASVVLIRQRLDEQWRIPVPRLRFVTRPPNRTLINLPTQIVYSSPSRTGELSASVAGISVHFRAVADRRIQCSPNCTSNAVADLISFSAAGVGRISAVATWRATFDALGLTEIPVTDSPIVQQYALSLDVVRLHRFILTD
jgi:hypothetical protein